MHQAEMCRLGDLKVEKIRPSVKAGEIFWIADLKIATQLQATSIPHLKVNS